MGLYIGVEDKLEWAQKHFVKVQPFPWKWADIPKGVVQCVVTGRPWGPIIAVMFSKRELDRWVNDFTGVFCLIKREDVLAVCPQLPDFEKEAERGQRS